jgi:uncharacterized protein YjbJ (UPF0337 family)
LAARAKRPAAKQRVESLKAEGQGDQAKSDVKQAGEKVKDAFKKD